MSIHFTGDSDSILQSNVLKTIGMATSSLLVYAIVTDKVLTLTDFLKWAQDNEQLDKMIRTLTNEVMTLENFVVQLYYTQKKRYVRKHQAKLREDIEELEKCLEKNFLSENKCLIEIIGEKRRLLRLLTADEDTEES